jgi:magnesium transporter
VPEQMDQEELSRLFATHRYLAFPVVDQEGRMKGIVTLDDIVDVVREEATEDIQKIGGTAALDAPYLRVGIGHMIRKRAGWLAVLFLGESLTATAMGYFEAEIARAVVLALFVPLVISSGGNSGSQATTLVIRAMALGEVKLRDWWRVMHREILSGLGLGAILASIGILRILLWQSLFHTYGAHSFLIAMTVASSLVGVVLWGSLVGSMLPFVLRRLGLDPATASAPFVATLVDVTGLIIYFSAAKVILSGTLL